jgi:hypothetical protein
MTRIITVENEDVIVNEAILGIPEFRAMYDYYLEKVGLEETVKAFMYLHFIYDPESPYMLLAEEDRKAAVKKDFRGKYRPSHDAVFLKAAEKMKSFSTPVARLLEALKTSMGKISTYLETTEVSTGKDGNLAEIIRLYKEVGNIVKNYNSVEADFKKEVNTSRGRARKALDEGEETDDF